MARKVSENSYSDRLLGNEQHFLALALNGSVLEQARGIMTVLEQCNVTPAFILLRSFLDAVVDLFNLVDDGNYKNYMVYQFLNERKRIFSFVQKNLRRTRGL